MASLIRKQSMTGTFTKAKPYTLLHRGGYCNTPLARALARLALVLGPTRKCKIVFSLSLFVIFWMTGRAGRNPLTPIDACGSLSAFQKIIAFPPICKRYLLLWSGLLHLSGQKQKKKKLFCQTLMQLLSQSSCGIIPVGFLIDSDTVMHWWEATAFSYLIWNGRD